MWRKGWSRERGMEGVRKGWSRGGKDGVGREEWRE